MEKPRELFLGACEKIAGSLTPLGFKFARSRQRTERKAGDFAFRISFQSSHMNVAGRHVALRIHANVLSKRLAEWRSSRVHALRRDDYVAGGQIGNLVNPHGWRDWNLATSTSADVIKDASKTVHSIALPYFDRFADVAHLCALLQHEPLPAFDIAHAIEFLLCFENHPAAEAALINFFRARPDLVANYQAHLAEFRGQGLPKIPCSGFAYQLAFVTVAYDLTPPSIA